MHSAESAQHSGHTETVFIALQSWGYLVPQAHQNKFTLMLSMMLPNHVYYQVDSLECPNDQESQRKSSQWTLEWCTHGHVPLSSQRGGLTKARIVFRDILRDRDMKTCVPHSLTKHTNQPSHQEVTSRAHRL